ncbi:MAG: GNAT family N-acetyltransferase [Blastochloris sp.]|nr:GNAT family N-acetyltransferase [Blastochloris sp.]
MRLPQELADGLRLRHATAADTEALVAFNRNIHSEEDSIAVREMLDPAHPRMRPQDFLLVENPQADNRIVSSACLIPETWAYDGIPFEIGMPEFVGTDPSYRQRGLMRTIMDALHQHSDEQGCVAQIIHGVPWFYRRFGYEYALTFWAAYGLPAAQVPPVGEEGEVVRIHQATADDAALIRSLHAHTKAVVATDLREDEWRYRLADTSAGSYTNHYFIVSRPVTAAQQAITAPGGSSAAAILASRCWRLMR